MIAIRIGLMLWALVILLLVLPFVLLESLVRRVPVRAGLRKWMAYWPANGWNKGLVSTGWRWLGDLRLVLLLSGGLFVSAFFNAVAGNWWVTALSVGTAAAAVKFSWRKLVVQPPA